jgi:hypothetical protein
VTIRTATATRVWRESDGGFRWQAGQVFGTADDETEAREAARRTWNTCEHQPIQSTWCDRRSHDYTRSSRQRKNLCARSENDIPRTAEIY